MDKCEICGNDNDDELVKEFDEAVKALLSTPPKPKEGKGNGQKGRKEKIEVTEEMVKAGELELPSLFDSKYDGDDARDIVTAIYRAMEMEKVHLAQ